MPFRAERAWLEPDWASIQRANRAKFKRRRDLLLLLSRFSRVRLCATPYTAAYQAPHPWDSPGKNTGVGCHFLLQCMKVKSESESEVAQSCPTLRDPMGYIAHQAPPSMGFSRQEYWSGVPSPSPNPRSSGFQNVFPSMSITRDLVRHADSCPAHSQLLLERVMGWGSASSG